jgi:hypothetical protein
LKIIEEEVLNFNNNGAPFLSIKYKKKEMIIDAKHSFDERNYYLTLQVTNSSVFKFT